MTDMPRLLWNYLRIEIAPADRTLRPVIGPGGLTREQALDDVQHDLDYLADHAPTTAWHELFRASADDWRARVPDGIIRIGDLVWAAYMHFDTVDAVQAAVAWCEDLVESISQVGGVAITVDKASIRQSESTEPTRPLRRPQAC